MDTNLRHWRHYTPGVETRPYKGLKNVHDFTNCFYTGILSLETKSDDDMKWIYPLRGMNTNGKQISISIYSETDAAYVYIPKPVTIHADFLILI